MEQQLAWFQDKVSTLATSNQDKILSEVRDRRMQLAAGMTHIAKQRMQDAYDAAKEERGAGMKKRILALLEKKALDSAHGGTVSPGNSFVTKYRFHVLCTGTSVILLLCTGLRSRGRGAQGTGHRAQSKNQKNLSPAL